MFKDPATYIPEAVGMAAETADRLSKTAHDMKDAAADRLSKTAHDAKDAAHRAQIELKKVRTKLARIAENAEELAKENPWATAATMLGVGVLLGAIGYKLFVPKPTLAQVLGISHLPDSARFQMKKQMKAIKKLF